jgi:hypothetical protein
MGKWRDGRTKAPWEKPYVHTDERDGGKYIDPDEYLNLEPVREQRRKLSRIVRSRPGAAQDR